MALILSKIMPMIYVQDIWHYYDTFPALRGVTLEVHKGEIFGLLGENGAGKSTLLQILSNLLIPTEGRVYINGKQLDKIDMYIRSISGYLPENPAIYERLTGREFLYFVGKLRGMNYNKIEERIKQLSSYLEFEDKLDMFTGSYSKGIRQKFAFASTVIHEPSILILDEPFSGLDPYIISKLKRYLRQYVSKMDRCIVFSTHITSFAEALCTKIAIIHKGEIIVHGTVNTILQKYSVSNLESAFLKAIGKE